MAEPVERQRTVLRAPRVDFDLSALSLGAVGWLAYQWTWPALASLLAVENATIAPNGGPQAIVPAWHALRWGFFHRAFGFVGLPYTGLIEEMTGAPGAVVGSQMKDGKQMNAVYALADQANLALPWWKLLVVGAWLLVLWSLVSGAISRVYALRVARDESIGATDALAFSTSNLLAFVKAPLFVACAAAVFLGLAALCGVASAVPVAGPYLEIVFHPLALLAGLVTTVIAVGGVFGLPVMQAAVATERNGALDAISRTFSYVFTRPVQYLTSVVIVTVVAGLISQFGGAFLSIATRALEFGASKTWNGAAPGTIDIGARFAAAPGGVLGWPQVAHPDAVPTSTVVGVYVAWAFAALALTAVGGFVLSYFVGGMTDAYFLLRRDVDGIDDSEVYVEGESASLGDPSPPEDAHTGAKP